MDKKTKRLHEEELVNEMAPVAPAQPAAPAEVEAAQPVVEPVAEELPQPTVEEPILSTPQEPAAPADPLTPPAPGMIPSGWIRPEDLAAAIAQQTGDVEVASTAEDATITEEPVPTESAIESVEAEPVVEPAAEVATPVVEEEIVLESISREELDVIREYRLYKALKEAEAEELPGDDLSGSSHHDAAEDDMAAVTDEPVSLNLQESEEDVEDEVLDIEEEVAGDLAVEDADEDDVIDMFDEEDIPEGIDYEDMEDDDIISSVNDFLANFDDFEASSEIPEVLRTVADFIEDVAEEAPVEAEELPSEDEIEDIEAALEEDVSEEIEEDIDLEDDDIDLEDDEEDFEESRHFVRRVECKVSRKDRLTEEVVYPAGSYPSNEWPSADSNLIRSYEESQARRREALRTYRESSINKPSENFTKALNSSVRLSEKTSVDSKSWSANKFLDKYKESREFSFNDLLRDGFLG